MLSSCSVLGSEDGVQPGTESTTEAEKPHFDSSWVTREASIRALARMLEEGDSEEVVADTGDSSENLIRLRVLVEDDDGYKVELDKDSWAVQPDTTGELDSALYDAMGHNEVTWCDPSRNARSSSKRTLPGSMAPSTPLRTTRPASPTTWTAAPANPAGPEASPSSHEAAVFRRTFDALTTGPVRPSLKENSHSSPGVTKSTAPLTERGGPYYRP